MIQSGPQSKLSVAPRSQLNLFTVTQDPQHLATPIFLIPVLHTNPITSIAKPFPLPVLPPPEGQHHTITATVCFLR